MDNCVEFPGWVSAWQAKKLMEKVHTFVHHSVTGHTSGNMEGMAMELPVIATYHSGIPELTEDGVHGFLME